jgi:hypothetical protein
MKKRIVLALLNFIIIVVLAVSCEKEINLDPENVLQVNNVGLREGVFVRRYKLTNDYGKHKEFTPEILKSFIKEKLEPDYLFLADAYDLGLEKDNILQTKIHDFRVNLIAGNHPVFFENLEIPKDTLQKFYEEKEELYTIDLVLANSYSMADSMYKYLLSGKNIVPSTQDMGLRFPQFYQHNLTYGEILHPILSQNLIHMKIGEVCTPVFTNPTWSVMRLNKKTQNKNLGSYDKMLTDLVQQMQVILKYKDLTKLIDELKVKYPITINGKFFPLMISAYKFRNDQGWIDMNEISESDLNGIFLKIANDEIPLYNFIISFNSSMQLAGLPQLKKEDLDQFVENYCTQDLLYLDGLKKGADQNALVKDKLINKEHRFLLTKYLNEEIGKKAIVTDDAAINYYNDNRDKWKADYETIEKTVKQALRKKLIQDRRQELINKSLKKYKVIFNEELLKRLADQFTEEKKEKSAKITS